jgi:DegV family protein with EDD domain
LIEQHELEVVPSILIIDGKEYADGIGISREDFYNRLPSLQSNVTTAAPSIGDFAARYDSLLARDCDHILSIHAAGTLTTLINSARQAAHDFPNKITLVDSGSLSLGLGFQVLAAAEAADDGLPAALEAIESTRKRLSVFAALDTMENLKRSGRVPGIVAFFGGVLSIKPMVEIRDGNVKPIGATRTTKQADERMLDLLLEAGEMERLAILHTNAEARAKALLNGLMNRQHLSVPRDILFVNVTAVIGAHLGANGLGFAAVRK